MKKIIAFIMNINLNPKLIVTALLKGLSNFDFLAKIKAIAAAALAHTADYPSLDPDPAAFKIEVQILDNLMTNGKTLIQELKTNTEAQNKQRNKITDIVTDKWCGQVQTDAAGDVEKVKQIGLGIKGVDNQQGEPKVSIGNSKPIITDTDINRHLEHSFTVKNSASGLIGLPLDAKSCEVYEFIGATEPTDIKQMSHMGSTRRGKFTNHFTPDQVGQYVWYMCIYVPKASATGSPELSGKIKLLIT